MIEKEFTENIWEILNTFHEVVKQMRVSYFEGNFEDYASLSYDLIQGVESVREVAKDNLPENDKSRLVDACTCIIESAKNIFRLADAGSSDVAWKLENELEDFVEASEIQFLYHQMVANGYKTFEEYRQFLSDSHKFRLLRTPEKIDSLQYDLSISVTGYNKLEYTKRCVESVLRNIPLGIRCELILINHGSCDGTQEYFESIPNVHVINIAINGALPAARHSYISAPFFIGISNDVIIGKYALANIYKALVENEDYGYIVPSTPNVCNLQTINAKYESMNDFDSFCENNNHYDVKRHEQRIRLCNPLTGIRYLIFLQRMYDLFEDFSLDSYTQSFPDDKNSLWMRRHGYKNILMKDSYCHHFGSITIKEDKKISDDPNDFYLNGRKSFAKKYGIDPWGTGHCYDYHLFRKIDITPEDNCYILGINCGLGSNSLKIKEILKEKGAKGTTLINFEQGAEYIQDLIGVSDEAYVFDKPTEIKYILDRRFISFIVIENEVNGCADKMEFLKILLDCGFSFGTVVLKSGNGEWLVTKSTSSNDRA